MFKINVLLSVIDKKCYFSPNALRQASWDAKNGKEAFKAEMRKMFAYFLPNNRTPAQKNSAFGALDWRRARGNRR